MAENRIKKLKEIENTLKGEVIGLG